MTRSVRAAIGSVLLIALMGAGYLCGRSAGAKLRHRTPPRLLVWNPEPAVDLDDANAPSVPSNEVFASVLDKVQHDFVNTPGADRITNSQLTDGVLAGMIASLQDPHTQYLTPTQSELRTNTLLGRVAGIGARLSLINTRSKGQDIDYRYLTVQSVMHGGPAERAGLLAGDRVTEINGQWVIAYPTPGSRGSSHSGASPPPPTDSGESSSAPIRPGLPAQLAIEILTSGSGKTLRLTVDRRGKQEHFDVTTAQRTLPSAEHSLIARGITYLKVNALNESASEIIDTALRTNRDWTKGLIIDLRQNSGGVEADAATRVDGYQCAMKLISYIARKPIAGVLERSPGERQQVIVRSIRPVENSKSHVVALVDSGTAGIAELAAAGMRDAGGVSLIGCRTSGDDLLTRFTLLPSGGAIETVSAHLYSASGVDLDKGVKPDYEVETYSTDRYDDPAIRRAKRLLGV